MNVIRCVKLFYNSKAVTREASPDTLLVSSLPLLLSRVECVVMLVVSPSGEHRHS